MASGIAALLAVCGLTAVLYPLLRRVRPDQRSAPPDAASHLQGLLDRHDLLLRALRDLEDDHHLGNVRDADYTRLRADYERQAMAALKSLDDPAEAAGQRIEEEVRVLRRHAEQATAAPAGGQRP